MRELLTKLEHATSGDRTLDALIEVEVRRFEAYRVGLNDEQRAIWKPVGDKGEVEEGGSRYHSPAYTFSMTEADRILPWPYHPCATFSMKVIQNGIHDHHYCTAEFTWPSTECQGRGRTPELAMAICGLRAIEEGHRQMAPYIKPQRKRTAAR